MAEEGEAIMDALTAAQADRELRRIGALELEVEALEARMLAELDEVKGRYAPDLARLRAKHGRWVDGLEEACRAARESLFAEGAQTLALGFGQVGYRASVPRLEVRGGLDEEEVIGRLPTALRRYVRTKRSLDRAGLRAAAMDGNLTAEDMERLGLVLVEGVERWQVKPDHDAVREAVGRA